MASEVTARRVLATSLREDNRPLPLHVAWSGRRVYGVGDDDQRLVLYALLLAEAQREDLERFVHRESLVSMWPRLRRLLGPHARREWERKLMTTACR
jgi:hypothetical protein